MANMTIDEATPKGSVAGTEVIPVSDSETPKSVTAANIKDYVLDAVALLTQVSTTTLANDDIYIKQDGAMKRIGAATLAETIYARLYGKDAVSTFSGTDVVAVKNGNDYKTTTLEALTTYLKEEIDPTFDIHAMTSAGTLVGSAIDGEEVAVAQKSGTTWSTLKTTIVNLAEYVIGKLMDVTAKTTAIDTSDYIFIQSDGAVKKVLKSNAGLATGNVTTPSSGAVAGNLPAWETTNGTGLTQGYSIASTVGSSSTNSSVPTAAAVYSYVSPLFNYRVWRNVTTQTGYIPQWGNVSGQLTVGLTLQESVRASSTAVDTALVTEAAVRTELDTKVTAPSDEVTEDGIPQWDGSSATLTSGLTLQTTVRASGTAVDTAVATEAAIRTAIDAAITAHVSQYHSGT